MRVDFCRSVDFSFSDCNCDPSGTEEGTCDKETGECLCREGYSGERCDQCSQLFWGYPDCKSKKWEKRRILLRLKFALPDWKTIMIRGKGRI